MQISNKSDTCGFKCGEYCTRFYDQDNGAHGPKGAQCAELHMSLLNDAPNNLEDQSASVLVLYRQDSSSVRHVQDRPQQASV